jgi:hypothetical protein
MKSEHLAHRYQERLKVDEEIRRLTLIDLKSEERMTDVSLPLCSRRRVFQTTQENLEKKEYTRAYQHRGFFLCSDCLAVGPSPQK